MPPQKEALATSSFLSSSSNETSCSSDASSSLNTPHSTQITSPHTILCTLVMIDSLSVSLIVPLLHQYYKSAGVHSASQREMLSSLFSSSQIVGGLTIGALSDLGILSRRRILFVSFLGSALSYALIMVGGIYNLICSRVIVGLVKQTMTVSTSLMAHYTDNTNRTMWMGRLGAWNTAAWIIGPSIGAFFYRHAGQFAPPAVACILFLLNSVLAAVLLPSGDETNNLSSGSSQKDRTEGKKPKISSFFVNLKACFTSSALASVVIALLLYGWVTRATSYANMSSFYEEKYDIEPHFRGYIKSYQMFLNFLVQSFLVKTLLSRLGGESNAASIAAFTMSLATFCEVYATFPIFAGFICPLVATSVYVLNVSLRSLLTQVAPKESLGSVLAALDVLQNVVSVTVPFYRTILFRFLTKVSGKGDADASMMGDPDPHLWLLSSCVHWIVFANVVTWLLLSQKESSEGDVHAKKRR